MSTISYVTTRLQAGRTGFRTPVWTRDFSVFRNDHAVFEGPPGLLFSEQRVFSPGVKGSPGHEVNQLCASSTKFKKRWNYTSAPPPPPVFIHGAVSENFAPPTFLIYFFFFLLVFLLSFVSSRLSFCLPCSFINSLVFSFCLSSSLVCLLF